jgi:hypothetical protein
MRCSIDFYLMCEIYGLDAELLSFLSLQLTMYIFFICYLLAQGMGHSSHPQEMAYVSAFLSQIFEKSK